jgi:hypothetical protein
MHFSWFAAHWSGIEEFHAAGRVQHIGHTVGQKGWKVKAQSGDNRSAPISRQKAEYLLILRIGFSLLDDMVFGIYSLASGTRTSIPTHASASPGGNSC